MNRKRIDNLGFLSTIYPMEHEEGLEARYRRPTVEDSGESDTFTTIQLASLSDDGLSSACDKIRRGVRKWQESIR